MTSDRGSALVITVMLVAVAATTVTTLTSFTHAVQLSSASARLRHELTVSAASAVRLVAADHNGTCAPTPRQVVINSHSVQVHCTSTASATTDTARRGVITTANNALTTSFTPPAWAGTPAQAIAGDIVVNTGSATTPSSALLDDITPTWQNRTTSWTGHVAIPVVPVLPAFERPGALVVRNGCTIYYPGRYLGSIGLSLSGGLHYFASGTYYFERPISVTNGARVVFGSGDVEGCTTDTWAINDIDAPTQHALSGRGATMIFGGAGRLTVQESSVVFNRRVINDDSNDIAIRVVTTGVNTSTLTIPADQMRRSDGTTGPLSGYLSSTLSPTLNWAVDIRLNGASITTNRFLVDGYIHAPMSGARFTSTVTSYAISLNRGLTSSRVTFSLGSAPNDLANYRLGFVARPGRIRTMLQANASARGRDVTAEKVLDQ